MMITTKTLPATLLGLLVRSNFQTNATLHFAQLREADE